MVFLTAEKKAFDLAASTVVSMEEKTARRWVASKDKDKAELSAVLLAIPLVEMSEILWG
jgi:hypothetical protein